MSEKRREVCLLWYDRDPRSSKGDKITKTRARPEKVHALSLAWHCSTRVVDAHERERDDLRARGRAHVRIQYTVYDRPTGRHDVLAVVARRVVFLRAQQKLETTRASAV